MEDKGFKTVAIIILAVGGYFIYTRVKSNQKTGDADVIVSSGNSKNKSMLLTYQPGYVTAWANAIKGNKPSFVFGTKTYSTTGGRALK